MYHLFHFTLLSNFLSLLILQYGCPTGYMASRKGGPCYTIPLNSFGSPQVSSYMDAKQACAGLGASLATIHTVFDGDLVASLCGDITAGVGKMDTGCWLGDHHNVDVIYNQAFVCFAFNHLLGAFPKICNMSSLLGRTLFLFCSCLAYFPFFSFYFFLSLHFLVTM